MSLTQQHQSKGKTNKAIKQDKKQLVFAPASLF